MFLKLENTERDIVKKFLQAMQPIPPVQAALRQIDVGAQLFDIAATLSAGLVETFEKQQMQIGKLQREVLHKVGLCADYQKQLREWQQGSLQEQLRALKEKCAEEFNSRADLLLEKNKLEREHKSQAQELQRLRGQVVELNRLVAKQHGQISNLIGSDTP